MSSSLFLDYDACHDKWSVLDIEEYCYGDGKTPEEAVQSARKNGVEKDIDFNYGTATYVNEPDSNAIMNTFELIDELARLAGMKVNSTFNNEGKFCGYTMELRE